MKLFLFCLLFVSAALADNVVFVDNTLTYNCYAFPTRGLITLSQIINGHLLIANGERCDFTCADGLSGYTLKAFYSDPQGHLCDPSLIDRTTANCYSGAIIPSNVFTDPQQMQLQCSQPFGRCNMNIPPFMTYSCTDGTANIRPNGNWSVISVAIDHSCTFTTTCSSSDYTVTCPSGTTSCLTNQGTASIIYLCQHDQQTCLPQYAGTAIASDFITTFHVCQPAHIATLYRRDVAKNLLPTCQVIDYTYSGPCQVGYYGQFCLPCPVCDNDFLVCDEGKTGSGLCIKLNDPCPSRVAGVLSFNEFATPGGCLSNFGMDWFKQYIVIYGTELIFVRRGYIKLITTPRFIGDIFWAYLTDLASFENVYPPQQWLCNNKGQVYTQVIWRGSGLIDIQNTQAVFITQPTNYVCECPVGFYGSRCELTCDYQINIDPNAQCYLKPYLNGTVIPATRCNRFSQLNPSTGLCDRTSCPEGQYGQACEHFCTGCGSPLTRRGGEFLTRCGQDPSLPLEYGNCTCPIRGQLLNYAKTGCSDVHCGPDGKCTNNQGECFNPLGSDLAYCRCKPGFHGKSCEHTSTCLGVTDGSCREEYAAQGCDCGVRWDSVTQTLTSLLQTNGVSIMGVYSASYVSDNWPRITVKGDLKQIFQSGASYYLYDLKYQFDETKDLTLQLVNNQVFMDEFQAQFSCYNDSFCQCIAMTPRTQGGGMFVNYLRLTPVNTTDTSILLNQISYGSLGQQPPHGTDDISIRCLTRDYGYRCIKATASPDHFDHSWYYFDSGYRQEIEDMFCSSIHRNKANFCCLQGSIYDPTHFQFCGALDVNSILELKSNLNLISPDPWYKWAELHWRTVGHRKRYSPNAYCQLTPTLWDSRSMCTQPRLGCASVGGSIPCSNNGRCELGSDVNVLKDGCSSTKKCAQSRTGLPYTCVCDVYDLGPCTSTSVSGKCKWGGRACQYSTADACVPSGGNTFSQSMCNGEAFRCVNVTFPVDSPITTTDPVPGCDCDTPFIDANGDLRPSTGIGQFCTNSRCGPGACTSLGSGTGFCQQNTTSGAWACKCSQAGIGAGPDCSVNATSCLVNMGTEGLKQCAGRGTCHAPSEINLHNDPNYNFTHSWCECTLANFTGPTCEQPICNPTYLESDHGYCTDSGAGVFCYPAWAGSPRCNISYCATSGGTPQSLITHYDSCSCPVGRYSKHNDINCWPTPPVNPTTGQVCGSISANQMQDAGTYLSPTARATCLCGTGWVASTYVDNVTHITENTCIPQCSVYANFVSGQCVCIDPLGERYNKPGGTGRCDDIRCAPNGVWDRTKQACVCVSSLYNKTDNCDTNTCNTLYGCDRTRCGSVPGCLSDSCTKVTRGVYIPQRDKCDCFLPYTPSSPVLSKDCFQTVCGTNGVLKTASGADRCVCNGLWRTGVCDTTVSLSDGKYCVDPLNGYVTRYCKDSFCQNGGLPMGPTGIAASTCSCPFPFTSTPSQPRCQASLCNPQFAIAIPGRCVCLNGFTGPACDLSPCVNGGVFDIGTMQCACANGWSGGDCNIRTASTGPCSQFGIAYTPPGATVSRCICLPLWTGATCADSRCLNGASYSAADGGSCVCPANYAGYLCEVYVGPPTQGVTSPPTSAPTEVFQNQQFTIFAITLPLKYWVAIAAPLVCGGIVFGLYVIIRLNPALIK